MRDQDIRLLCELLLETSGLRLTAEKQYLLEARLTPLALKTGHASLEAMVETVRYKRPKDLVERITQLMTTNESYFFRDSQPFEALKAKILPELNRQRMQARQLRIWSAASSTGQEAYSIAMLLAEQPDMWTNWSIDILGTDISNAALETAREGVYSQFEVQRGLPIQLLVKHFDQEDNRWRLKRDLRQMVRFESFNLMSQFDTLSRGGGRFDIIFLRNVLIYFDKQTKAEVLKKARQVLADDGAIFLGASENLLGLDLDLTPVSGANGLYRPAGQAGGLSQAV